MRTPTKVVSVAATVFLSFSLLACGSSGSSTTSSSSTETQTTEEAAKQEAEVSTLEDEATEQEAQTEQTLPTEFAHGTINGNTYSIPFFGFTYTIGDDMTFANDEQLAQLSGFVADTTDNDDYVEYLESGKVLIDMYAEASSGKTVNFTILNGESEGGENATIEIVRVGAKQGLEESLSSLGITDIQISDTTVTVGGRELLGLDATGKLDGRDVYERMVYFKNGAYFGQLTFAASDMATIEAMKDGITFM